MKKVIFIIFLCITFFIGCAKNPVGPVTPVLSSISISPLTPTVAIGGTINFIGSPKDQDGNAFAASVSWTSSNVGVGTINSNGVFTGIAAGNTTVTGTAGTFSASTVVSVATATPVLSSISISPLTPTVAIGGTINFIGSPKDQYGNAFAASVSWSSSNVGIGTINSSGVFTGIASGNTTVTGTAGTFSASTLVSVQPSLRYMYLKISGDGPIGTASSFMLTIWVTTSSTSSTIFNGNAVIDASDSYVWQSTNSDGYTATNASFHWELPVVPSNQGLYVEIHKIINGIDTIYASGHLPANQTGSGGSHTF